MMEDYYSQGLFERLVINPLTYKGKGRPRRNDYISLLEANKLCNQMISKVIDSRR